MTDEISPYVLNPEGSPYPQSRSRTPGWMLWIGLGCGGSCLFALLCCAGCGVWLWRGQSEVEPVAAEFLATVDRGDDAIAYQSLGQEWKSIQTEPAFTEFMQRVRELLGPLRSKSFRGIFRGTSPTGPVASVTYAATYAKGSAQIRVSLKKSSQGWHVIGCQWNSPIVQQALKCPHCGATNVALGNFCTSCGKSMKE